MPIEYATMSREERVLHYEEQARIKREEFESLMRSDAELLDEDGYPTDHALEIIEKWDWDDQAEWFKFIEELWYLRSWGWSEEECEHEYQEGTTVHRYHISTAGWSGNESIITSMKKNVMLWHASWVQSRRGGHYIFEIEKT